MKNTLVLLSCVLLCSCAPKSGDWSANAKNMPQDPPADPFTGACSESYASQRNKVVEDASIAFLDVDLIRLYQRNNLPPNPKVDPSQTRARLVNVRDELAAFLASYSSVVCTGLVLECKPEFASSPECYLSTSQSDWVKESITNESLVDARNALDRFLAVPGK